MTRESIRDVLSKMYQAHGELTAELVVDEATPDDHPLHDRFQWDDARAGHEFRLIQARTLIREVHTIVVAGREQTIVHVPPVVVEGARRVGTYVVESALKNDDDAYQRALDAAIRDLESARRRVEELRAIRPGKKLSRAAKAMEQASLELAA